MTWILPKTFRHIQFSRISILISIAYIYFCYINITNQVGSIVLYDGQIQMTNYTLGNEIQIMFIVTLQQQITQLERSEIYFIIQISQIGVINMVTSNDLQVSQLSLQQINQAFYFLQSINKNSEAAQSAGIKYLLLSAFTTAQFQQSIQGIYSNIGSLSYDNQFIASEYLDFTWPMFFFLIAMFFKQGLAPFHSWVPDVYEGSPSIITLWQATVPKITILAFQINIYPQIPSSLLTNYIPLVGIISVLVGSIGLGGQFKIKRFQGYSAISHMGYIMLAFSVQNLNTVMFYYTIYAFTTINIFAIIISISPKKDIEFLSELSGLFRQNPALAISLGLSFLSQAGLPPQAGFFAKVWILLSLIQEDQIQLAVIVIIASTISTAYYQKMVKVIFQDQPNITKISLSYSQALLITFLTFFIIQFMLKPMALLSIFYQIMNVASV